MEEIGGASITAVQVSSEDAVPLELVIATSMEAEIPLARSSPQEHAHGAGASTGEDSLVTRDGSLAGGNGLPPPGSESVSPVLASAEHTDVAGDASFSVLNEAQITGDAGDEPSSVVGTLNEAQITDDVEDEPSPVAGTVDEAQDTGEDEDEPSPVVGTLDDAQRFFDEGRTALRNGDYDQAAELLSQALEIRALHHGELALECAFTYYKYGCALLYKAQSESDPLGGVKEAADTETGENGKDEEEEDVEEEESDLDMAWKMLDIARVIYEKQQSHSIEEVDVITALADVSLEREDFEMCFRDYTRALEILEGLVEPDDRGIAELCFKLSLAQQLGYKPKEALRYCQQAVSVCESRLRRLRNEVAIAKGLVDSKGKSPICDDISKDTQLAGVSAPANSDVSTTVPGITSLKQEDEIKEIEQLLEDLKDKVVELQEMASGPSLLESLKESNPGAVNSIKQVFSVTAQLASQEGSSRSGSHAEPCGGFDTPSISSSTAPVTDLGIVGRGVKRATPVPVSNGLETTAKKRSLDDMMTRGGAGDTQIGFGSSTASGGSS